MASKVPKFGAWEGGENYTVYFDNARKVKHNGAMINPNDPEENPGMFPLDEASARAPSESNHRRADSQGSKVPQFGAWDNGDNVGYTVYFENARKTKNNGPSKVENEPQINRDLNNRSHPPPQNHPATAKPEPQEARSKVPQFGAWEGGGEVAYTEYFDKVKKTRNEPSDTKETSNGHPDATPQNEPPAQEARAKVPQFGAWEGGENVAYTAYFGNARKNKAELVEPQLNRDVGERARPASAATKAKSEEYVGQGGVRSRPEQGSTKDNGHMRHASRGSAASVAGSESHHKQGRLTPGGQSPLHPRGGKPQLKPGAKGTQTPEKGAAIPPFGVWNDDPAQAEGFTGTFMRAREDRMTPLNKNTPAPHYQKTQYNNQEPKKGCCFPWFG